MKKEEQNAMMFDFLRPIFIQKKNILHNKNKVFTKNREYFFSALNLFFNCIISGGDEEIKKIINQ